MLVCGPVLAELLAGTSEAQREEVWRTLIALPWADLDSAAWRETGFVAHALRHAGQMIPLTDVMIAVACVRAQALLWTRDRDFERIQKVLPALQLYEPG